MVELGDTIALGAIAARRGGSSPSTGTNLRKTMKHLEEIGETYWEHCKFALLFALVMIVTGILLVIHAFFPNAFKSAGSDVIKHMYAILEARSNGDEDDDIDPV